MPKFMYAVSMIYSIILFTVLFVVIWLMHKPFNVHKHPATWIYKFHCILENVLIMQFMIILNEYLKLIK